LSDLTTSTCRSKDGQANSICFVHAFQKKSTHGIKTPKHEIDLVKARLKRLKESLG